MAFTAIAKVVDLYDGCRIPARIGRTHLLLLQWEGQVYLIEDKCPHMDAPLSTGKLSDGSIVCRVHGIGFKLCDGQALGPLSDTLSCLKFFPVVYEGNWVGVEL